VGLAEAGECREECSRRGVLYSRENADGTLLSLRLAELRAETFAKEVQNTFPAGQGEPVNIIISGHSDPTALVDREEDGGLRNYFLYVNPLRVEGILTDTRYQITTLLRRMLRAVNGHKA
jgi:hypothetical protein